MVQDERLRLAVSAARIGTWDYDPVSDQLRWDARCKAMLGLKPTEEVDFAVFLAGIHPEDRERVHGAIRAALRGEAGGEYEIEFRTRGLSDGVERWLAANGRAFFDDQGRPLRFIGTALDITERKRTEQTAAFLARASEILCSSMDSAETLSKSADLALPLLGDWCLVDLLEDDGSFRRVCVAHVDPDRAPLADRLRRLSLMSGQPGPLGRTLLAGSSVLVEQVDENWLQRVTRDPDRIAVVREIAPRTLMAVPLVARGAVVGAFVFLGVALGRRFTRADLAIAEDFAHRAALAIDNAKLYRDAQRAIRARDEFLSVASHELKTPLTPLGLRLDGWQRLLEASGEVALLQRLPADLELMRRQVRRIAGLVDELLDVSRITTDRLHLRPEPVELGALLREVVARAEPEAARAHSPIELRVGDDSRGEWDRLRLEQVVENLLANALKYGAGAPVRVQADTHQQRARIEISDQGIGIAPEAIGRIFGRFERAVSERHYGGLGLGLYVARQIVSAMGGTISVNSRPNQGACFTIELPLRSA